MPGPMPTLERNADNTFNILVDGVVVERNVAVMDLPARMRAHWGPMRVSKKTRKADK